MFERWERWTRTERGKRPAAGRVQKNSRNETVSAMFRGGKGSEKTKKVLWNTGGWRPQSFGAPALGTIFAKTIPN